MREKAVRVVLAAVVAVFALASVALAQSVSFQSNLGGSARYGLIDGTKLYSLIGSRLYIADITMKNTPVELGSIALPGIARRMAKDDNGKNVVYISCSTGGLVAVDISVPSKPVILSATTFDKLDGTIGQTFGVAAKGQYVYAADYSGVFVLDMTNPAAPVQVTSFTAFEKEKPNCYDSYIDGTTLYVSCEMDGLYIFDISTPTALAKISHYQGQYYNAWRDGNYLYVAAGGAGFEVLNISDIAHPQHVTILNNDFQGILGVVKVNGFVYLCSEFQNFYKIDVSDPAHPVQVAEFLVGGNHSLGISVTGDYVALANSNYGIRIFDTRAAAIQQVGAFLSLGRVIDCKGSGDFAYAAVGLKGLAIINMTNPQQPLQVAQKTLTGYANGLAISGPDAYVAETNHEGEEGGLLEIVDVSNPLAPILLGSVALAGQPFSVQVQGNIAVVASQTAGIAVVDVSDKSSPRLLGTYDTAGVCYAPQLWGDYIIAADGLKGFAAIDNSDPTYPKKIAGGYDLGNVIDVALWDTWMYLPASDVLHIASFDPLYNPVIDAATIAPAVDARNQTGQLKAAAAYSGYLLVADSIGGARLFDIAQPNAPQELASATYISGDPLRISFDAGQGIAYMSNQIAGLYIYKVGLPAQPAFDASGIWAGAGTQGESAAGITADLYQAHAHASGTLTIYGATVVTGQVTAAIGAGGHLTGTILYGDGTSGTIDLAKSGSGISGSISGSTEISGIALSYVTGQGLRTFESSGAFMADAIKAALASAKGLKKSSLTRAQKMMAAALAQTELDRQLGLSAFAVAWIGPRAAAGTIPAAEALLYQSALWETQVAQAETASMAASICADYKNKLQVYQAQGDRMLTAGTAVGNRNLLVPALASLSRAAFFYKRAAGYYKENVASCPTWGKAEFSGYYVGVVDFGFIAASMKVCAAQDGGGVVTGDVRIDVEASGEHMTGSISDGMNTTANDVSTVTGTILVPLSTLTAHIVMKDWKYNAASDQWEGQIEVQEQKVTGNITLKKSSATCPEGFPAQ